MGVGDRGDVEHGRLPLEPPAPGQAGKTHVDPGARLEQQAGDGLGVVGVGVDGVEERWAATRPRGRAARASTSAPLRGREGLALPSRPPRGGGAVERVNESAISPSAKGFGPGPPRSAARRRRAPPQVSGIARALEAASIREPCPTPGLSRSGCGASPGRAAFPPLRSLPPGSLDRVAQTTKSPPDLDEARSLPRIGLRTPALEVPGARPGPLAQRGREPADARRMSASRSRPGRTARERSRTGSKRPSS